jgi:hypothetical protein
MSQRSPLENQNNIKDVNRVATSASESARVSASNPARTTASGAVCSYFALFSRSRYCASALRTCQAIVLSVLSERIRNSRITLNGIRKAMVSESVSFGGMSNGPTNYVIRQHSTA